MAWPLVEELFLRLLADLAQKHEFSPISNRTSFSLRKKIFWILAIPTFFFEILVYKSDSDSKP